ncbi:hypothetical protein J4419_04205 [Candidatus Woesearchaeota archaeon]|nr:hypothetical protein [Candidatus Woesearchaeota archaeon]
MELKDLCKKLNLNAESLEREFDLLDLEFITPKTVARKIVEKVDKYCQFTEAFLNADGVSFAVLIEIKTLDTRKLNETFMALNLITREYMLADLKNTDQEFLSFITRGVKEWVAIKPELMTLVQQAKDAWKDSRRLGEELGYFG